MTFEEFWVDAGWHIDFIDLKPVIQEVWQAAQKSEREKYKELIETSEGIVLTQEIYGGIPIKMIEHLHEVLERIGK